LADSQTGCIPYAYIEGEVMPVNQSLYSHHMEGRTGVIQHIQMTEHKSKSVQGIWTDVTRVIQDRMQMVPFLLRKVLDDGSNRDFHINNPSDADLLTDTLTVTYDHFEPSSSGFLSRVVDRVSGEVTKGYQETEKMLLSNSVMRGLGEVTVSKGKLQLRPPVGGMKYILTTLTRKELIQHYQKQSFWVKVFGYFTGAIGALILFHIIRKNYKKFKENRERRDVVAEIRRRRERNNAHNNASANARARSDEGHEDVANDNSCVVCLTNQREIVLLNCGHICLCAECLEALPVPLKCPVCRQRVERYVVTYNP